MMNNNVGTLDRLIRLILAAILVYLGLIIYADSLVGIGLDVLGAIATFSGVSGFCGLYRLLGINTQHSPRT